MHGRSGAHSWRAALGHEPALARDERNRVLQQDGLEVELRIAHEAHPDHDAP